MATFTRSDDLQGAEFVDADLRGARFVRADLSGVVMRGVEVQGADIDAPRLFDGEGFLRVNGVDVIPLVEAELNRRFPGRADRRAGDPDGLRAAWANLERTWAATLERVAAMPAGTVDVSVGGEWSFAQTLRHPAVRDQTSLIRCARCWARDRRWYEPTTRTLRMPGSRSERPSRNGALPGTTRTPEPAGRRTTPS